MSKGIRRKRDPRSPISSFSVDDRNTACRACGGLGGSALYPVIEAGLAVGVLAFAVGVRDAWYICFDDFLAYQTVGISLARSAGEREVYVLRHCVRAYRRRESFQNCWISLIEETRLADSGDGSHRHIPSFFETCVL
jgi:hypothetical protein